MENKHLKIEIVFTAIILIVACFVMGITVINRDKKQGDLTMDNYTEYMQVECRLGNGTGYGDVMSFKYFVTVKAKHNYKLEDVRIAYSIKNRGENVSSGTITVTLDAGEYHSEEFQDTFKTSNNGILGMAIPLLEITVTSVSGTYKYTV